MQKLPTAAVVAAVAEKAEKGCNSGFKLVIAENLKTVANTNFSNNNDLDSSINEDFLYFENNINIFNFRVGRVGTVNNNNWSILQLICI